MGVVDVSVGFHIDAVMIYAFHLGEIGLFDDNIDVVAATAHHHRNFAGLDNFEPQKVLIKYSGSFQVAGPQGAMRYKFRLDHG
jgi:hypothetical protein